jgi:hypothetical protein
MRSKKEYSIDLNYLKKSKELTQLKENFQKWVNFSKDQDRLPIDDALIALRTFGVTIPRILIPSATYPIKLYRVRVIPQHSDEDISNPKTFSYPPVKHSNSYQRASAPGFPVFYGAMDGKTAFEETRINGAPIKAGDAVFLSEWRVKNEASCSLCFLTTPDIIHDNQLFAVLTKKVYSEIERIFKFEEFFFRKTQRFLYEQISALFLTGTYSQSGTVAHDILFKTPEVNGIKINGVIYPSCANNFRSVNCALTPEFADENLTLESVRKLSFEQFSDDGVQANSQYFGEVFNGKIIWQTYVSQLFTNKFQIILDLTEKWNRKEIKASKFFFHNRELDLQKFCKEKVAELDLNNFNFPQKKEREFKSNSDQIFVYELKLEDWVSQLTLAGKKNTITAIKMLIPHKSFLEEADLKSVLS